MIIDVHAHLVAPAALYVYRAELLASGGYRRRTLSISDDELSEAAARNVKILDSVGTDVQLISPRPYQQMHSAVPPRIVHWWIEENNDLIARTVKAYPNRFAGVAGLPLCAGQPVETCFGELRRAVEDLGCVGVSLNPDPGEGQSFTPGLGDPFWYPLFELLSELNVPALIHSAGCNSGRESYSEHFITEESVAILSMLRSSAFDRFPDLRIIISHGGGSVPYQIGRWQAERLSPRLGGDSSAEPFERALRRLWFDTVLHNRGSLELLFQTVGADRCLFGTENPGSGSVMNPATGRPFDDIKSTIEEIPWMPEEDRARVFELNARQVFPRLKVG